MILILCTYAHACLIRTNQCVFLNIIYFWAGYPIKCFQPIFRKSFFVVIWLLIFNKNIYILWLIDLLCRGKILSTVPVLYHYDGFQQYFVPHTLLVTNHYYGHTIFKLLSSCRYTLKWGNKKCPYNSKHSITST